MNAPKTAAMNVRHGGMRNWVMRAIAGLVLALVGLISASLLNGPIIIVSAQTISRSWSYTGSLNTPRSFHTATLLPDGKVLVTGGLNDTTVLDSAELYDPETGTWSYTGSLNNARDRHTATLLTNGKVLVAGGPDNLAELYDPATGTWSLTGNLNVGRYSHTATLLRNGKVLIAGGLTGGNFPTNAAEIYDPAAGTWSLSANLNQGRFHHTATLLANGKLLVAGGAYNVEYDGGLLVSAETYDPETGTWNYTGSLKAGHVDHAAVLLQNGDVLLAGDGQHSELYKAAKGKWSNTDGIIPRFNHTLTLLQNGKALIAGGANYGIDVPSEHTLSGADIYNPQLAVGRRPPSSTRRGLSTRRRYSPSGRCWSSEGMTKGSAVITCGAPSFTTRKC